MSVRVQHIASQVDSVVSNFGSTGGGDLLAVWREWVEHLMSTGGLKMSGRDKHFIPVAPGVTPGTDVRAIRTEFDYGTYNTNRRIRDVNLGTSSSALSLTDAASDQFRSLFHVPLNGVYAFLTSENIGQAGTSGVIKDRWTTWFEGRYPGYTLLIDFVDDAASWTSYLDDAQLRELVIKRHRTIRGDRTARRVREDVVLRGEYREILPKDWLVRLMSRDLRGDDLLTRPVEDEEIEPVEGVKATVSSKGRTRRIEIGSAYPKFVYEVLPKGVAPTDGQYYDYAESLIFDIQDELGNDPTR